jgi:hypothetical protein
MSILHFKFVPHIIFNHDDQENDVIFPTGNPQLNQLILPGLLNDRIDFKFNVSGEGITHWKVFHYQFNTQDNLIHIWVRDQNDILIAPQDLSDVLWFADPNGGGPDGWMSGNTTIVDDSIAEQFGYDSIELIPYVSYVGVLVPQQTSGQYTEYEVDRTRLPPLSISSPPTRLNVAMGPF